jgi:hypothetical protein
MVYDGEREVWSLGKRRKEERMFSETYAELRYCYERMNFPLETVCSSAGVEHEDLRRAQLIGLCVKITEEYGGEGRE